MIDNESATGEATGDAGNKSPILIGVVTWMSRCEVQLKDAKAKLSSIVDDVGSGEAIVITRHGRREAVLVLWDAWQRLSNVPSFARLLMASPLEDGDIEPRARSSIRDLYGMLEGRGNDARLSIEEINEGIADAGAEAGMAGLSGK